MQFGGGANAEPLVDRQEQAPPLLSPQGAREERLGGALVRIGPAVRVRYPHRAMPVFYTVVVEESRGANGSPRPGQRRRSADDAMHTQEAKAAGHPTVSWFLRRGG